MASAAFSLSLRAPDWLRTFFFLCDLIFADFPILKLDLQEKKDLYELFLIVKAPLTISALLFGFIYFAVYKSESVKAQLLKCFTLFFFLKVGFWMILFD